MTREEAKTILALMVREQELSVNNDKSNYEALRMALQALEYDDTAYHAEMCEVIVDRDVWEDAKRALEQEPLEVEATKLQQAYNKGFEDCRQAVLNEIPVLWNSNGDKDYCMESLRDFIAELPSVNPQEKTGHWIFHEIEDTLRWYECDQCGAEAVKEYDYCHGCGARMVDPQESEDKK